jgi:hypothetical protein
MQPLSLPENHAGALTPVVTLAGTTNAFEQDRVVIQEFADLVPAAWIFDASFLGFARYFEALATEAQHFRHEWKTLEHAFGIESLRDFSGTLDQDKVAGPKFAVSFARHDVKT